MISEFLFPPTNYQAHRHHRSYQLHQMVIFVTTSQSFTKMPLSLFFSFNPSILFLHVGSGLNPFTDSILRAVRVMVGAVKRDFFAQSIDSMEWKKSKRALTSPLGEWEGALLRG